MQAEMFPTLDDITPEMEERAFQGIKDPDLLARIFALREAREPDYVMWVTWRQGERTIQLTEPLLQSAANVHYWSERQLAALGVLRTKGWKWAVLGCWVTESQLKALYDYDR